MSIVKSLSVGNGDMFYIRHNTDNFTIIDCCMSEDTQYYIVNELKRESEGKGITRFISTHPDDDHIRGLAYLHKKVDLLNFYVVKNEATKEDETEDFDRYCVLRDDPKRAFNIYRGCTRRWMNESDEERQHSGIHIFWPDTDNQYFKEALAAAKEGECPNNISAIIRYGAADGAAILWMGDLDKEFMENIGTAYVIAADILFAPHHGRDSGRVPDEWLAKIKPKLIIVGEAPSEHLHYYPDYDTITQNSAGDITLELESGQTHIYVSNSDYSVDFLTDERQPDNYGGYYIGTLKV